MSCYCGTDHTVCLSNDCNVYSFGSNDYGQLGLGVEEKQVSIPNQIQNLPKIKIISCGEYFTICVDNEGSMWSFGRNNYGQLGTGNKKNYNTPQKIPNIPPIQSVSCGFEHTLMITNDLNLWSVGRNTFGQLFLESNEDQLLAKQTKFSNILKITTGGNHSIFQNNKGEIYVCGYNKNGELGLGHFNHQFDVCLLLNNENDPLLDIIQFACGNNHSLFLDSKGNVFSCGYNAYGSLGLDSDEIYYNKLMKIKTMKDIQSISCLGASSYLIDKNNSIWSFGNNAFGQLGLNDNTKFRKKPIKINSINEIIQISRGSCGSHFLAKNQQNQIFVMGKNNKGQLGIYSNELKILTPIQLNSLFFPIWGENNLLFFNEKDLISNDNLNKLLIIKNMSLIDVNDNLTQQIITLRKQINTNKKRHENELQLLKNQMNTKKNQNVQFNQKNIFNIWKHIQFRNWVYLNKKFINSFCFFDIVFLGKGCNGLVMKASISWNFNSKNESFIVALKMIINIREDKTVIHSSDCKNEYDILTNSSLQLHPNIVRFLGEFTDKPTENMLQHVDSSVIDLCYRSSGKLKGAQFFMVQYYEKTLENVIKNENPSTEIILNYAIQLSRALLHLYESKIAHLDLKLDNIMISEINEIVIVDFGCAIRLDDSYHANHAHTPGNPSHLSPEIMIAFKNNLSLPCESQFSWELGVILYEMFSKELPWDTDQFSILNGNLRLASVPEAFHFLLKNLLCAKEERMHIVDAWKYLEELELP